MDIKRSEQLMEAMASVVWHPLTDRSPRIELSALLADASLQFAAAVRSLCEKSLGLGASTTLRSQYEALIRSVWALHCATDSQVARLSAQLSQESQQASKNIPLVNEMLAGLEKVPALKNLLVSLNEFKSSSWIPLNSFIHSGIHAVHRTKYGFPPEQFEIILRTSNGLAILAYQSLAILTGRPNIQRELFACTATFSSVLPEPRKCT